MSNVRPAQHGYPPQRVPRDCGRTRKQEAVHARARSQSNAPANRRVEAVPFPKRPVGSTLTAAPSHPKHEPSSGIAGATPTVAHHTERARSRRRVAVRSPTDLRDPASVPSRSSPPTLGRRSDADRDPRPARSNSTRVATLGFRWVPPSIRSGAELDAGLPRGHNMRTRSTRPNPHAKKPSGSSVCELPSSSRPREYPDLPEAPSRKPREEICRGLSRDSFDESRSRLYGHPARAEGGNTSNQPDKPVLGRTDRSGSLEPFLLPSGHGPHASFGKPHLKPTRPSQLHQGQRSKMDRWLGRQLTGRVRLVQGVHQTTCIRWRYRSRHVRAHMRQNQLRVPCVRWPILRHPFGPPTVEARNVKELPKDLGAHSEGSTVPSADKLNRHSAQSQHL